MGNKNNLDAKLKTIEESITHRELALAKSRVAKSEVQYAIWLRDYGVGPGSYVYDQSGFTYKVKSIVSNHPLKPIVEGYMILTHGELSESVQLIRDWTLVKTELIKE